MNKKYKNLIKFLVIFLLIVLSWIGFFIQNDSNYIKLKKIELETVKHPDKLPTKKFAKASSFWFENTKADILWLETIQYIWWNALSSQYKKYLFAMLDLITYLNPYFENPYKIWMLLLPDYNPRYEEITENQSLVYVKQAEKIWLKWIKNFCDLKKIDAIKKQDNLQLIWSQEEYKNPCKSYEIPYFLAYVYYFHLKDPKQASTYYKIASANTNSIEWAKILAAIMKWKWWEREKAFLMFLSIWKSFDSWDDKVCSEYALVLEKIWFQVFREWKLNSSIIRYLNESREKVFWKFDETKEHDIKTDSECATYVNKSIREMNLYYIEQANKKYKKDNLWVSALNAKVLYDKKYIDYLPIDFQQYKDYWIIYEYNKDTGNFDYDLGNY